MFDAPSLQLNAQRVLIHQLQKTGSKVTVNGDCRSDNFLAQLFVRQCHVGCNYPHLFRFDDFRSQSSKHTTPGLLLSLAVLPCRCLENSVFETETTPNYPLRSAKSQDFYFATRTAPVSRQSLAARVMQRGGHGTEHRPKKDEQAQTQSQ